ncbi:thioredoxin domain-containing protein [Halomarina pelagica]|uniref:thioredoxin domain-containing protein n=1 Tax=Halomarina pelagica TaxID=2961599 RepID=UPI0020C2139E|nr:thioredoxin domain-containing protein [Halomarina sp. BND7]
MTLSRRRFLAAAGATGVVGLAGCLGSSETMPDGPVTKAPVPKSPGDYTYATMGDGGKPVVTYIGNWKCVYCAAFSTNYLKDIVTKYVEPGKLSLEFRSWPNLIGPDDVRAARAGLAVWNVDPKTYWTYHEYVMANQPPESQEWATTDKLVSFAESAGVSNPEAVRRALEDGTYQQPVQANRQYIEKLRRRYPELRGTPALIVDGTFVPPIRDREGNPTEEVKQALQRVAEN